MPRTKTPLWGPCSRCGAPTRLLRFRRLVVYLCRFARPCRERARGARAALAAAEGRD